MIEKITGNMMNFEGFPTFIPNIIVSNNEDFYISYNNCDIHIYGDVTTALVYEFPKGKSEHYYVLNGNHVKQYNELLTKGGGIKECLEYFKSNQDLMSKYSDKLEIKEIK